VPYGYHPTPWSGPLPSSRWPYGPDRPGVATAAAVLGFVTAGLTLLMSVVFLGVQFSGDGDTSTAVLLLGIPCAAGLIVGGVRLLGRRSHQVLFTSAVAAVLVLILAFIVGLATLPGRDDVAGLGVMLLVAAPLPIVTACLAASRTIAGWTAGAPR
jgi:hypothetical protein